MSVNECTDDIKILCKDKNDPQIRKNVREALWLLAPEIEEVVTSKPQDEC